MADLFEFIKNSSLPAVVTAVIAHAQFETIHPFVDGNGRIGRALMGRVLTNRFSSSGILPVAIGFSALRDEYFGSLVAFRQGDADPILKLTIRAIEAVFFGVEEMLNDIGALTETWAESIGRIRTGGATSRLLGTLLESPIVSASQLAKDLDLLPNSIYSAISRLLDSGILVPATTRKGNQIWAAPDVFELMNKTQQTVIDRMGA
jgi:Fic family protein